MPWRWRSATHSRRRCSRLPSGLASPNRAAAWCAAGVGLGALLAAGCTPGSVRTGDYAGMDRGEALSEVFSYARQEMIARSGPLTHTSLGSGASTTGRRRKDRMPGSDVSRPGRQERRSAFGCGTQTRRSSARASRARSTTARPISRRRRHLPPDPCPPDRVRGPAAETSRRDRRQDRPTSCLT
jgi:hypothetical protein